MADRNSKDHDDILFYFYYDLAKKMVLNHPTLEVLRVSCWLKALESINEKNVRNSYIKLLVMALQHPEPLCPFKNFPPARIDPLENEFIEMARQFMKKKETLLCVAETPINSNPIITTAVSNDKCQYAATQIIENVGVQSYFAHSNDNIHNWILPPQIIIPKEHMHANDVDWERTAAGIQLKNITINIKEQQESDDEAEMMKDETLPCRLLNVEQQNRNITENFTWSNSSLLTGEITLGAEMCSDRNIDAQVKTQIELDEAAIKAYDKVYPGDFKIVVNSLIVNEIIGNKKHIVSESGDKNFTKEEETQDNTKNNNNHNDIKNHSLDSPKFHVTGYLQKNKHLRQSAGQENISKFNNQYNTLDCYEGNDIYAKCNRGSIEFENLCKPRSVEKSLSFQKASLEFKRTTSEVENCLDNVKSLFRINNKDIESFE